MGMALQSSRQKCSLHNNARLPCVDAALQTYLRRHLLRRWLSAASRKSTSSRCAGGKRQAASSEAEAISSAPAASLPPFFLGPVLLLTLPKEPSEAAAPPLCRPAALAALSCPCTKQCNYTAACLALYILEVFCMKTLLSGRTPGHV